MASMLRSWCVQRGVRNLGGVRPKWLQVRPQIGGWVATLDLLHQHHVCCHPHNTARAPGTARRCGGDRSTAAGPPAGGRFGPPLPVHAQQHAGARRSMVHAVPHACAGTPHERLFDADRQHMAVSGTAAPALARAPHLHGTCVRARTRAPMQACRLLQLAVEWLWQLRDRHVKLFAAYAAAGDAAARCALPLAAWP